MTSSFTVGLRLLYASLILVDPLPLLHVLVCFPNLLVVVKHVHIQSQSSFRCGREGDESRDKTNDHGFHVEHLHLVDEEDDVILVDAIAGPELENEFAIDPPYVGPIGPAAQLGLAKQFRDKQKHEDEQEKEDEEQQGKGQTTKSKKNGVSVCALNVQ